MLKIETDRLSVGLNMAVADVLGITIGLTRHARKGQKLQNYLNDDCFRQNENDIPIKDYTVAEN